MSDDYVRVFDTTLRDGEQSPGINLNAQEKLQIAYQLAALGVDVIEAGFPAASPGDAEAVRLIAQSVKGPAIAGLSRTRQEDIKTAFESVKHSDRPRIHVFIATSDIHMQYKLKMTKDQVLGEIRSAVTYARSLVPDVEFSAEDGSRSDPKFLAQAFRLAAGCGATTLNLPDTVGYAIPEEFSGFFANVMKEVGTNGLVWSVHCHDDLGLAVANTLAAVKAGARQVECTINGIGERAGNASLEEIVMALKTRREHFGVDTHINTTYLYPTSRLVTRLTGFVVPPNKAIVGDNAFSHEAGIHQHGVLCDKRTYEIMRPQDVGAPESKLVLGKHSGRHAFGERIKSLGYHLTEEELAKAFVLFKDLCDKKGIVSDGDIEALIVDEILGNATKKSFELRDFMISIGAGGRGSATVVLADGEKTNSDAATGNGPVDAAYKAIQRIIGIEPELVSYKISAVSERSDAVGEAVVVIKFKEILAQGRGASTDVIEASIKAYINAINRLVQIAEARGINLFPQCVPA